MSIARPDCNFTKEAFPEWMCPTCNKSVLEYDAKKFTSFETAMSLQDRECEAFEYDWIKFRFNAVLTCSNKRCKDQVSVVGIGQLDCDRGLNEMGEFNEDYYEKFEAKFFIPSLNLILVPDNVPNRVKAALDQSFELYFCDSDSCGSRIRTCIEVLLDELKIPNTSPNGKFVSLHSRIEQLSSQFNNIKQQLKAIKWLGNTGTHSKSCLSKKDTLDAYAILKYVLDELYDDTKNQVEQLTTKINALKGPATQGA
jgi:hypothetical protein